MHIINNSVIYYYYRTRLVSVFSVVSVRIPLVRANNWHRPSHREFQPCKNRQNLTNTMYQKYVLYLYIYHCPQTHLYHLFAP